MLVAYAQIGACAAFVSYLSLPANPVNFKGLPRTMSAAAYIPSGEGFYLLGGLELDSTVSPRLYRPGNDMWQFSRKDNAWRQIIAEAGPGPRSGHTLCFDENSDEVFLLGGVGARCLDTLWSFSPLTETWTASPTIPGMGSQGGTLLDDQNSTLWSVFGRCGSLFKGIFSRPEASGSDWVFLQNVGASPVEREGHVAALDSRRNRLLIYGGVPPAGTAADKATIEVWAYSLADSSWEKLSHAGTGIRQERSWGAGAYSPASDALIVYGGIQTGIHNPDWYSQYGEIFQDLAVFDLRSNSWSTVPVTEEVGPRARAASSYCPCTGTLLVAGGDNTSLPISVTRPPTSSIHEIQIEKRGVLRLAGNGIGQRKTLVGFLDVPDATGDLEDLRLVDCVSGNTIIEFKDPQRLGRGRYQLKVPVEAVSIQPGTRVTGRIHGESLGFIATIERGTSTHRTGPYKSDTAARRVSIAGSAFLLEASPGSQIRVEWFDVRGRLLTQQSYEPTVVRIDEPNLSTGVYFARVSAGGTPVIRRVFVGTR